MYEDFEGEVLDLSSPKKSGTAEKMDRKVIVQELLKTEQRVLCTDNAKMINGWFKELTRQDNSIVMQVTEKAKTTTLYHLVLEYNLNTRGEELTRPKMISLVRREINKQKNNQVV